MMARILSLILHLLCTAIAGALLAGCSMPRVVVLNDPLDARQHNDLGASYQARGEDDLALREYDRAAELDSEWALPLVNRGNVFAGRESWGEAADSYRRALRRDPRNAEALNNLAWVLLQEGEIDEALKKASRAVEIDPGQPTFLDTLADIYLARGEVVAARQALRRALALDPGPDLRKTLEDKLTCLEEGTGTER